MSRLEYNAPWANHKTFFFVQMTLIRFWIDSLRENARYKSPWCRSTENWMRARNCKLMDLESGSTRYVVACWSKWDFVSLILNCIEGIDLIDFSFIAQQLATFCSIFRSETKFQRNSKFDFWERPEMWRHRHRFINSNEKFVYLWN